MAQNFDNIGMANVAKQIYNSPTIVCPKCGSKVFKEAVILKKVSKVISPTGKEELYPIPVFVCNSCGAIPDEFLSKPAAKEILGEESETKKESSIIF